MSLSGFPPSEEGHTRFFPARACAQCNSEYKPSVPDGTKRSSRSGHQTYPASDLSNAFAFLPIRTEMFHWFHRADRVQAFFYRQEELHQCQFSLRDFLR